MSLSREHGEQEGQSVLELALLLPVLLLIMAGVLDIGRAFHAYVVVVNAAREGARYASMHPADCTEIKNHVWEESGGASINLSGVAVGVCAGTTCSPAAGCTITEAEPGTPVTVSVQYELELVTNVVANPITGTDVLPITASSSMVQY